MKRTICFIGCLILVFAWPTILMADVIDFEGFADQAAVTNVITATNVVTFTVGSSHTSGLQAYAAKVGSPETAFVPNDTPNPTTNAGETFLTDEINGPSAYRNYYMVFSAPVNYISLDLYDYCEAVNATATLTGYTDEFGTPSNYVTFTQPSGLPDGHVQFMGITTALQPYKSASLVFSAHDTGTGIDNIEFTTVPVPPSAILLSSGLLSLVGLRRFRRG